MKKQIALALTAALLVFPVAPGLVLADTTSTGTTSVTSTTTQPSDTTTTQTTDTTTATPSSTTNTTTSTDPTTTTSGTDATTPSTAGTTVQDQNGTTVTPGILPDSPLYWFQTLIEKVQVALTFDPAKKAEVVEHQALENLAEAQALTAKGDTTDAEKALTSYSIKIEQAQTFLDQLKDPTSETAQKLQAALTKVNTNNMVVLGGLLEKLPPQAAQKLALNIVRSMEKAVAKADKMAANSDTSAAASNTATTSTSATSGTSTVNNTTNTTGTEDQAQLQKQAKQALEQFQVELGLKKADHTPNGNAYGYYNKESKGTEDSTSTQDQTQTQQAAQPATQEQSQAQQSEPSQVNPSAKTPMVKEHGDQNKNDQKSENGKGHRD